MKTGDLKIAEQLHRGNAQPPFWFREAFYLAKEQLCRRLGQLVDHDIQEIRHVCYACDGSGHLEPGVGLTPSWLRWPKGKPKGPSCPKCGGSGIYACRRYYLERWRLGPYVFHRPVAAAAYRHLLEPATIIGRIQHEPYPDSGLCALRIAYMYAREELEHAARAHCVVMLDPEVLDTDTHVTRQVKAWMEDEHARRVCRGEHLDTALEEACTVPF